MNKYQYIHELWLEYCQKISSSPTHWMNFLQTCSWSFKYSFDDQILIYAQKPNAKACADFDTWNNQLNRWIKKNSKGIALLSNEQNKLRYVFDIEDTRSPINQPLHLWKVDLEHENEFVEMIKNNYQNIESNNLSDTIIEMSKTLVKENIENYLPSLIKFNQDSSLEYLEEIEIKSIFSELMTNSISYQILNRCNLDTHIYFSNEDFDNIILFNTMDTVGQLGVAVHDLTEIGLDDISKLAKKIMIRTFEENSHLMQTNNEENERSKNNERINIQSSWGLSNSKHQTNGETSQQLLRKVEIELPSIKSSGSSVRIESEESTQSTSPRNRTTMQHENGSSIEGSIEKISSSKQRNRSIEMGSTHEQSQTISQRNYSQGDNLQLDLNIEKINEDTQNTGGNYLESLPPFDLSDLPQLLREDVALKHPKQDIIQYFKEHADENERTAYLEECYDDTLVQTFRRPESYDFSYIGYKKHEHGLDVWRGNYLDKESSSHLTFFELQKHLSNIIDSDDYLLPSFDKMTGLQLAYSSKIINRNVDYYIFQYNVEMNMSSPEIIEFFKNNSDIKVQEEYCKKIYPPKINEWIVDGITLGYEPNKNGLHIYLGKYDNQVVSQDLNWQLVAMSIDGMILSRYFDPTVQIPTLEEQSTAVYDNIKNLQNGIYFSQEEVDRILQRGSGVVDGKYRIYQEFTENSISHDHIKFLKNEYGTVGSSPAVGVINEFHDSKGIQLTKGKQIGENEIDIVIKWDKVSKRISELIDADRYLNQREKEQYPLFLEKQMQNQLAYERKIQEKQLNKENEISINNIENKDVNKEYQWTIGDTVFIGSTKYTIIEDGNEITLQDENFPLLLEYYSKEDFLNVLKENPLNEHLLKPTIDTKQKNTNEEVNDDEQFINKYLAELEEKIKYSSIYSVLQERDTSIDEAIDYIKEELIEIMPSYENKDSNFFNKYLNDKDFRDLLINKLIDRTYQDYTFENSYSNQTSDENNQMFKMMKKIAPRIMNETSAFYNMKSQNVDNDPLMIYFDRDEQMIDMFQYYEVNGIETSDPYIKFKVDFLNKTLEPVFFTNGSLELDISSNIQNKDFKQIKNDLEINANQWLASLLEKRYFVESEQVYVDNTKTNGIYHVDYEKNTIIYSDMPSSLLNEFASKNGYKVQNSIQETKIDYHITNEHLGEGTPKERYQNNIAAIKLLFNLEKDKRNATKDEQEVLAKYVGWGGLSDVFDESKSNWTNEYIELKTLLSEEEYQKARESTLTAFYTPPVVIDSIYKTLDQLGFKYGNILEPSCGTGNFLGMIPDNMKDSKLYGIELDSISGRIAKQLYQNASIAIEGYENTNLPDSFFDVAIGNIPFGQFGVIDKKYDKFNFKIHDYFFAKTIDKVRPGGIIAFITSRYTMDKANSSVRKYINERAELLGAVRLPNNTFSKAANTQTVSDIIFLQKRERPLTIDDEWLSLNTDDNGFTYNSYFINNPNMVLGKFEKTKAMYGRDDITVVPYDDIPLKDSLNNAIKSIHGHLDQYIMDESPLTKNNEENNAIPADPNVRNFSYTVVDGEVYFRENSQMSKIELSSNSKNRIKGLIDIRDCVRRLIDYQKDDYPDKTIKEEQQKLNTLYAAFSNKYGLINSRGNSTAFKEDSSYYLLCSLENINDDGTLKSKADIFSKRTIRKKQLKDHVDSSNESLLLSLNEKGKVDLDYMVKVTGFDRDKILNDLKGVIYKIPNINENQEDRFVTADEYLSGNIRQKLEIAKMASTIDSQYLFHVEQLSQAMPQELTASEIEVRLGATWIEPEIYKDFMFELLSTGNFAKEYMDIFYNKLNSDWFIKNKNYD